MSRLEQLKAMLEARRNQPGYKANCEELAREIAKLEAESGS
jgi:hypothetical protein